MTRSAAQQPLTPELLDLMEHEKPLEDSTSTPADVWWALVRIRDDAKYRAAGYETFDDYLTRWNAA